MIIQSSDIGMSSKRSYAQTSGQSLSLTGWKSALSGAMSGSVSDLPDSSEEKGNKQEKKYDNTLSDLIERLQVGRTGRTGLGADTMTAQRKIRYQSLSYLWQILFGNRALLTDPFQQLGGRAMNGFSFSYTEQSFYHEEEATSFSTTGKARTGDGREIDFQMELSMSRSFTEAYEKTISFGTPQFTDPLVINLDCDAADVTDQKFYFDLDADGHEEYISMLGGGSGFLALDKNGDGKINDGSELFGTASGNGFYDLMQYDSDGNGWIDEADEVFKDLLIWTKDGNGNDRLIGLGEAGVGAIYLGSAQTDFSLNHLQTNEVNARIRSTGIFLYENGGMGTMQQLDFAQ